MNKVMLIGRMTKDPEMKSTQNQTALCNFTVAVDRNYKNADGSRTADFINCVAWRNTAQFIGQYFRKGNKIVIVGNIQSRSYDDNNGVKHYVTEVIVDEAEFGESANNQQATPTPAVAPTPTPATDAAFADDSDDLPFEV